MGQGILLDRVPTSLGGMVRRKTFAEHLPNTPSSRRLQHDILRSTNSSPFIKKKNSYEVAERKEVTAAKSMESPANNISNMRILALFRNAWHRLLAQGDSFLV